MGYKYTSLIWDFGAHLLAPLNIDIGRPPPFVLPIGISFFTFQALSYIADVYTGHVAPARRLWGPR